MTLSDAERAGWSATVLENLTRLLVVGVELHYQTGGTLFGKKGDWLKVVPVNTNSDSEAIESGLRALRIQLELDEELK